MLKTAQKDTETLCFHCGDHCEDNFVFDQKQFCCNGCLSVYQLLNDSDLCTYYQLNENTGFSPSLKKYDYLESEKVAKELIEFENERFKKITFYVPSIHCSGCLYLLENLHKLNSNILYSKVDFLTKKVKIELSNQDTFNIKDVAILLDRIGYPPEIKIESQENKNENLLLKIGVAGFCTGNIMLFSFPEYLGLTELKFKSLFNYLSLVLSLPIIFYSGSSYFKSVYYAFKTKTQTLDVPILLGILVAFLRSAYLILAKNEAGYLDTIAGLVFLLLVGKWYQEKSYSFLSFNRSFKSFFPLSVLKVKGNTESHISLEELETKDKIKVKHNEIIPADSVLASGEIEVDYSFITGESETVLKKSGESVFAGGKIINSIANLVVTKKPENSYLRSLWNDKVFTEPKISQIEKFSETIGKIFTPALIIIATLGFGYWLYAANLDLAINVFCTLLIIACPCALSLSYPFALGTGLRIFEKNGFYLKNIETMEALASCDTIIFDKTGTLTETKNLKVDFESLRPISEYEKSMIFSLASYSNHPKSIAIAKHLKNQTNLPITEFKEVTSKGITAKINGENVQLGKKGWLENSKENTNENETFLSINNNIVGKFIFTSFLRENTESLLTTLKDKFSIYVLSGDNDKDATLLKKWVPTSNLLFNQEPHDKLAFVKKLGKKAIMIGDGINDAGAIKAAEVGIALTENTLNFTPSSDAILKAEQLAELNSYINFSKFSVQLIKFSFGLSLLYNVIGITFGLTANLTPLVAAILMPVSSVTIVAIATLGMYFKAKKMKLWK